MSEVVSNSIDLVERNDRASVQAEVVRTIGVELRMSSSYVQSFYSYYAEVTSGVSSARMSYEQYDYNVVLKYSIKVVGWPPDIPFCCPSKIYSVTDLITLRDAWCSKSCRFVKT